MITISLEDFHTSSASYKSLRCVCWRETCRQALITTGEVIDDLEIIKHVLAGEKDSFAELVRRYHGRVYQLCYGMLGSPDKADEAAHEVFIKAYRFLGSFKGEAAFPTWLHRMAHNHCLDILRAQVRRKTDSLDALLEVHAAKIEALFSHTDQEPLSSDERIDTIETVLSSLDPDVRAVLVLREKQGLSYQEMADTLQISLDAVKSRLKRARAELTRKVRHLLKINASKT